jgi:hypothetical protein
VTAMSEFKDTYQKDDRIFRQGGASSTNMFNIVLEKAINIEINLIGTIYKRQKNV